MYPILFSFGPITIYTFGVFALVAFLLVSFVIWKRGIENHFSEEDIFDAIVVTTFWGLIGSRIGYIIFKFDQFGFSLLRYLAIIKVPGFSFLGGLIVGALILWLIAWKKRWDFFTVSDIAVTGLALGQAIGWLGALMAGFGMGRDNPFLGVNFVGYESRKFPVQILWSISFFILFRFLWKVEERYRTFEWYKGKKASAQTGFLTFAYLFFMGVMKVVLFFFSDVSLYLMWIPSEILIATVMVLVGGLGLYMRSGRKVSSDCKMIVDKFKELNERIWKRGKIYQ